MFFKKKKINVNICFHERKKNTDWKSTKGHKIHNYIFFKFIQKDKG